MGKGEAGYLEVRRLCDWFGGAIFDSLRLILAGKGVGILNWEPCGLASRAGCHRAFGSVFLTNMVWPLPVCIFSLSGGKKGGRGPSTHGDN